MITRRTLDRLYRKYNRRQYVSPDPLQFLYDYPDTRDREIVALIASSLAYGRVAQILRSVETVLAVMGPSPYEFLMQPAPAGADRLFSSFKHRFTSGEDLARLLAGVRRLLIRHGSLNRAFLAGMNDSDKNILPALRNFVAELGGNRQSAGAVPPADHLIPCPSRGSACKRLNLFLRWMVRNDDVDPGGWEGVPGAMLIVPLDTHMAKIGRGLGLTHRKSPDMKMAVELTAAFGRFAPGDPVKYDFALTRFGIRSELNIGELLSMGFRQR